MKSYAGNLSQQVETCNSVIIVYFHIGRIQSLLDSLVTGKKANEKERMRK